MSLVSLYKWDEGIFFISDGLNYDPESGCVGASNISKVVPFPHLSCAIGITGCGDMIGQMAGITHAKGFDSFDEYVEKFEDTCREAHYYAMQNSLNYDPRYHQAAVVLAGYSTSRNTFEVYRLTTYDKESINSDTGEKSVNVPFHSEQMGGSFYFSGSPSEEHMKLLPDIDECDPTIYLRKWLCALRQDSDMQDQLGFQTCVGGMIHATHILQNGVNSWVEYRWPDDVPDKPLNPSLGERFPAYLDAAPDQN